MKPGTPLPDSLGKITDVRQSADGLVIFTTGRAQASLKNRWNFCSLDAERTQFRLSGPAGALASHGFADPIGAVGQMIMLAFDFPRPDGTSADVLSICPQGHKGDVPCAAWVTYPRRIKDIGNQD